MFETTQCESKKCLILFWIYIIEFIIKIRRGKKRKLSKYLSNKEHTKDQQIKHQNKTRKTKQKRTKQKAVEIYL